MKTLYFTLPLFFGLASLHAQNAAPFVADSLTRALWHFDETSGSAVHDTSMYHNDGVAYGTTIVDGPFGHARSFNGTGDYVSVPADSSLNFGNASFTIDVWFKTTALAGEILRRGIAPVPGYMMDMSGGCIEGQIGANVDPGTADPLINVRTRTPYNDNQWHHARIVRDRQALTVSLYVDDTLAAGPVEDNLNVPIVSDRPLMLGRWENPDYPRYFAGSIAEVRLWSPEQLRVPLQISVTTASLRFGKIRVGTSKALPLTVTNTGYHDSLRVESIISSSTTVGVPTDGFSLGPGASATVMVVFSPDTAGQDTGAIAIPSNDPLHPTMRIPFSGTGIVFTQSPIIDTVALDPYYYGQANITWFRSVYDSTGAVDPVIQYTIWGRAPGAGTVTSRASQTSGSHGCAGLDDTWQYLATIPAAGFDEYSATISHPSSYSPSYWATCLVAAQTRNFQTYLSAPDSLAVNPALGVTETGVASGPLTYSLTQNYPNPFNPTTTIRGQWPTECSVELVVYDLLGREVATLADGRFPAGSHAFTFDASRLSSGVYLYRLTAGRWTETRRMLLLR
jgi:hypothetical protein